MAATILGKYKRVVNQWILIILVLLPVWMSLAWYLSPKKKLVIAIVDKTVLTNQGQEHVSLNWILTHEKYSKNDHDLYRIDRDYFGFFPGKDEKYTLKGLERLTDQQLSQLSNDAEVAYITDTYGIFKNEWFKKGSALERSGVVYGGLSNQDVSFIKKMRDKHKLVITEFNCLGSPTDSSIRKNFETLFGIRWSGWIGRYFDSFDTTTNKELPKWLIKNYRLQHNGSWPFSKSGIAFIHADDRVVILENKTHLNQELPYIYANAEGQHHYGLPEKIKYAFWFDILTADTSFNHSLAYFQIDVNGNGKTELQKNQIPARFPAITVHLNRDYRFYYFSGDFCDNPIDASTARFNGIQYFRWFMYNKRDPEEKKSFFWTFYRPLVTNILADYYTSIHPGK